jgi:putative glutamine amidotransferase
MVGMNKSRPLIGISCCRKNFGIFQAPNHAASDTYVRAVDQVVHGIPVLIPANGADAAIDELVERLDGIMLTGSRSNVQPSLYAGAPLPADMPEDAARDGVTMRLIRSAIKRGIPVLAICRGMQELNVALGGSLHQRLQDLPGHIDHSTPMQENAAIRTGLAHFIEILPQTILHDLVGSHRLAVNSLHNQGIDRLAEGLVVEARALDGTIEAVRGAFAGFVMGVQWHPEFDFMTNEISKSIFARFGDAARARYIPDP